MIEVNICRNLTLIFDLGSEFKNIIRAMKCIFVFFYSLIVISISHWAGISYDRNLHRVITRIHLSDFLNSPQIGKFVFFLDLVGLTLNICD